MMYFKQVIRKMGITGRYKGFTYMARAAELSFENEERLTSVTKKLYLVIAEEYETTAVNVERAMRTVIGVFWDRGNKDFLEEVADYHVLEKPNIGEFVDLLVGYRIRQEKNQCNRCVQGVMYSQTT